MAPSIDFPYANSDIVQKAVNEVENLKNESLAADKAIAAVKGDASDLVTKYKDNISALAGLPIAIQQFSDSFNKLLWATRLDGAALGASHINEFVDELVVPLVEDIKSPKDRDEAIAELKAFASKQPKAFEGFPGVSKEFGNIWAVSSSDAINIEKVLEKTADKDIKKAVEAIKKAFAPAKEGYAKVKDALRDYASQI